MCASLFSASARRWQRFGEQMQAGALFHDRAPHTASGRVSFAGYKSSGSGDVNGVEAILALRRPVALFERDEADTPPAREPLRCLIGRHAIPS